MRVAYELEPGQTMPDLSTRYSPELLRAGSAFSYATYQHSRLPIRLFEAARIATAVINGCTACMSWRSARDVSLLGVEQGIDAAGPEPDEAFYQAVLAGDLSQLSEPERLAVIYAQRMGTDPRGLAEDEAFWAELKAAMSDEEIVDLTYCAASWIGLGRAAHVLGQDAVCALPGHVAQAAE